MTEEDKDFLKNKLKEIYDFVEQNQIQSFYCAGYDYHPKTTLMDLTNPNSNIQPNMILHLNTSSPNYLQEKTILQKRFPNYYFVYSNYNNKTSFSKV
jgi:hypothetical protein